MAPLSSLQDALHETTRFRSMQSLDDLTLRVETQHDDVIGIYVIESVLSEQFVKQVITENSHSNVHTENMQRLNEAYLKIVRQFRGLTTDHLL